jgi:hypothetical protein
VESDASEFFLIGVLFNPEDGGSISPKTSINFYQTTRYHIPEDITL